MSPVTTAAASAASAASSSGCVRAGQQLHTHPSPRHKHRVRACATTRLPRVCNCYEQPPRSPAPSRAAHVAGPLRTSATQPEKTLSLFSLLLLPCPKCNARVHCRRRRWRSCSARAAPAPRNALAGYCATGSDPCQPELRRRRGCARRGTTFPGVLPVAARAGEESHECARTCALGRCLCHTRCSNHSAWQRCRLWRRGGAKRGGAGSGGNGVRRGKLAVVPPPAPAHQH